MSERDHFGVAASERPRPRRRCSLRVKQEWGRAGWGPGQESSWSENVSRNISRTAQNSGDLRAPSGTKRALSRRRIDAYRVTHNPSVAGSSPARPI